MKLGKSKTPAAGAPVSQQEEVEIIINPEPEILKEAFFKEYYKNINYINTVWHLEKDKLYSVMNFERFQEQFEANEETRNFLLDMLKPTCPNIVGMLKAYMEEGNPEEVQKGIYDKFKHPDKTRIFSKLNKYYRDIMKGNGISFTAEEEKD